MEVEVVVEGDFIEVRVKVVIVVTVAEAIGEEEKVGPDKVAPVVILSLVEEDKDPQWGEELPLLPKSV